MDWVKWYCDLASVPGFKAYAWRRVNEMAQSWPEHFGELPELVKAEMQRRAMTLKLEEPRCLGHGAGASGHQHRADCVNCLRRLAPRPSGIELQWIDPPKEYPCPERVAKEVKN